MNRSSLKNRDGMYHLTDLQILISTVEMLCTPAYRQIILIYSGPEMLAKMEYDVKMNLFYLLRQAGLIKEIPELDPTFFSKLV